jgi:hypothetical protein
MDHRYNDGNRTLSICEDTVDWPPGNQLRTKRFALLREDATSGERAAALSDALSAAAAWAKDELKPVVAKDLDFVARKPWGSSAQTEHACSRGCSTSNTGNCSKQSASARVSN